MMPYRFSQPNKAYEYPPEKLLSLGERLKRYEKLVLICELQREHRSRKSIAKVLGISLRTLYYKLEQHDLQHYSQEKARKEYFRQLGVAIHE